ncbi:inactive tRNA-specific adenosine deaminase-like protein 3 isoform X2 [Tripterygium wilfordii]|uniref:Inactive tRNA-specific adenosine deaminase-like protein 3 isoform X2 n=1 Tax=Tripterygium wilfordii TaxID=458696 RepID=A0A7J7CXI0_TRIWF|nr:inactive tRNA-specific adenosine deaminase-like protein 3 isoform X2 [Tripterygium wilfordii]
MMEPKLANTLIRRLNQIAPLENLRHVKRIRKRSLEGGKSQLSVILCLACEDDNQWNCVPENVQELVNSYQLSPFIAQVCKYAASSKEEWEEQCKLWPTSYHPLTYNIDGIMGFSEEDSQSIFSFMKFAVELAKSSKELLVNAAVVVDPSNKQITATACDQINSWLPPESKHGHLFPALEHIGYEYYEVEDVQSSSITSPAKRPMTNLTNVKNEDKQVLHAKDSCSISERPYLCTGYDIFLVWEPCTMCAMALVHQRIRRIFYAFPNPKAGALGSVHRLQGEKSLNHHYVVFRILLPGELPTTGDTVAEIADKDVGADTLQCPLTN